MRSFTGIGLILLLFCSCTSLKFPEVRSMDGVKMIKMDGREISLEVKAVVYNPNRFSLKVKPSKVLVSAEEQTLGTVQLDQKVKLKGKHTDTLAVPLKVQLEEGAMLSMFRLMNKDSVQLHIAGKVKGGIGILSKKQKIDLVRTIPGKSLKFGMGGR